jgi:hypothetical protein
MVCFPGCASVTPGAMICPEGPAVLQCRWAYAYTERRWLPSPQVPYRDKTFLAEVDGWLKHKRGNGE